MQNRRRQLSLSILAAALAVSMTGAPGFAESAPPTTAAQADKPSGQGTIDGVDLSKRKLTITHGPIAALKWPGMTMDFGVAPGVDVGALKPGSKIHSTLGRGGDGMYVIDGIKTAE